MYFERSILRKEFEIEILIFICFIFWLKRSEENQSKRNMEIDGYEGEVRYI